MTYPDGTPVNPGDTVTASLPIKWITDKVYPRQTRTCTVRQVYEKSILVEYPLTFMNSPILQSAYLVAGEFSKGPQAMSATPKGATVSQTTVTISGSVTVIAPGIVFIKNPVALPPLTMGVLMSPYPLGTATGGITPYKWTVDAANPLPPGLSVDATGNLVGTPTAMGSWNYQVFLDNAGA